MIGTSCMRKMIRLSLLLNIAVLIPVCLGLLLDAAWVVHAYGTATAARGILLSVYGAILIVSTVLLLRQEAMLVAPLLLVQVVYKLTTPLTVGSLQNPVQSGSHLLVQPAAFGHRAHHGRYPAGRCRRQPAGKEEDGHQRCVGGGVRFLSAHHA